MTTYLNVIAMNNIRQILISKTSNDLYLSDIAVTVNRMIGRMLVMRCYFRFVVGLGLISSMYIPYIILSANF